MLSEFKGKRNQHQSGSQIPDERKLGDPKHTEVPAFMKHFFAFFINEKKAIHIGETST